MIAVTCSDKKEGLRDQRFCRHRMTDYKNLQVERHGYLR